jgi:hypothetical protein
MVPSRNQRRGLHQRAAAVDQRMLGPRHPRLHQRAVRATHCPRRNPAPPTRPAGRHWARLATRANVRRAHATRQHERPPNTAGLARSSRHWTCGLRLGPSGAISTHSAFDASFQHAVEHTGLDSTGPTTVQTICFPPPDSVLGGGPQERAPDAVNGQLLRAVARNLIGTSNRYLRECAIHRTRASGELPGGCMLCSLMFITNRWRRLQPSLACGLSRRGDDPCSRCFYGGGDC